MDDASGLEAVAKNLEVVEAAFRRAGESRWMIPHLAPMARFKAASIQLLLGQPTRTVGKPDSQMRR